MQKVQVKRAGFEERVRTVGERRGVSVRGNNSNDQEESGNSHIVNFLPCLVSCCHA